MRTTIATAFTLAALAGCVGNLETQPATDDGGGDGANAAPVDTAEARALFDAGVYPIIMAKCASCHSAAGPVGNVTGFVAASSDDAYSTVTGYVSLVGNFASTSAGILGKIEAGHNAIVYSDDEIAAITGWLDKEVELRADQPSDPAAPSDESPSAATARLLGEWSGCMNPDDFVLAEMPEAWGKLTTNNNQECQNCHVNGAEGFIASQQAEPFFKQITTDKYYMLQYFTVDLTQGAANAAMMINTVSFLGVSQGQDPHRTHPRFDATDNDGMRALQDFYDLTVARKAAGTCDPARLTN
jgi:hypothetical protein